MPTKGVPLSSDSKILMKISKQQTWKNKFKWELANDFLDIEIDNGSRNREKKFITIRKFKEFVDSGLDASQIISLGISKHLVTFLSAFCRGDIMIDKITFGKEYLSGMSLDGISTKFNVPREHITYLRQLFAIKAKGANFINRKKTELPLTKRQKEILYGSLMGDGKKMSPSSAAFNHGSPQKDYLLWKYKEFESVASKPSLKSTTTFDPRSGNSNTGWRFYTHANSDIEFIIDQFYDHGRKVITNDILSNLTPLSVAVWFMDDGKTDFYHRMRMKDLDMQPASFLCTDCFSKEEVEMMIFWFEKTYNIKCNISNASNGIGFRIRISGDDRKRFIDLIRPHVLPMFNYKTDYEGYLNNRLSGLQLPTRELQTCPTGNDFKNLSPAQKDEWTVCFLNHFREHGFNWLTKCEDIDKDLDKLLSKIQNQFDGTIKFSPIGYRLPVAFSKSFWKSKAKGSMSPKELFESDKYLTEIIWRIILSDRIPTRPIVLTALRRYRGNKSVGSFPPATAHQVFQKYAPVGSKTLDFCAGFGGRMLGAMLCNNVSSYTGIEANIESCIGLKNLCSFVVNKTNITKDVNITNQDAIVGMSQFKDKIFDFCFTSPPYFDAEEYANDNTQSSKVHNTYGEWLNKFMWPAIVEASRVSSLVAINIANTGGYPIADDIRNLLISHRMLISEDSIIFPAMYGGTKKEPLFLLRSNN